MSSKHTEVIIVGGGGMGLAAAWRLAKRGHPVRVLERFEFYHARGSSHTEHRIIRRTYDDELYAELMPHAYRLWEELEKDSGRKLVYCHGGVELGPLDDPALQRIIEISRRLAIPIDLLSPAEATRRFPQFRLPSNFVMVYCGLNGFLAVDDCVRAQGEQASRHGAMLQDKEAVLSIRPLERGAEVISSRAAYTCDKLILTAGPYAKGLLSQLGLVVPYTIEVNQSQWFAVDPPQSFSPERFPVFVYRNERDAMGGVYGFPTFRNPGIKIGIHHSNHFIEVEEYDMLPHRDTLDRVRDWVRVFINGASEKVLNVVPCLYDFPPDEHFVISLHPRHPDIAMANMAGHGFKFAPLVGEILAQLVTLGSTEYDLTGFGVERFFSAHAARRAPIHVSPARPVNKEK